MNAEIDDSLGTVSRTGCDESTVPSDDGAPYFVESAGAEFEDFLAVTWIESRFVVGAHTEYLIQVSIFFLAY